MLLGNQVPGGLEAFSGIVKILADDKAVAEHLIKIKEAEDKFRALMKDERAKLEAQRQALDVRSASYDQAEQKLASTQAEVTRLQGELNARIVELAEDRASFEAVISTARADMTAREEAHARAVAEHAIQHAEERRKNAEATAQLTLAVSKVEARETAAANLAGEAKVQKQLYETRVAKLKEAIQ